MQEIKAPSEAQIQTILNAYPWMRVIIAAGGNIPQTPDEIIEAISTKAQEICPGVAVANAGTVTEDLASTGAAVVFEANNAKIEAENSISLLNANDAFLEDQAKIFGVPRGTQQNPNVKVNFTGKPNTYISAGVELTDGNYTLQTKKSFILQSDGTANGIEAVATEWGEYLIEANTVNFMTDTHPDLFTVSNPLSGTQGEKEETPLQWRIRAMAEANIPAQGEAGYIKKIVGGVEGVLRRTVGVTIPKDGGGYQITAAGGDEQEVAQAIYESCLNLPSLVATKNKVGAIKPYTHDKKDGVILVFSQAVGLDSGSAVIKGNVSADISKFCGEWPVVVINPTSLFIPVAPPKKIKYLGGLYLDNDPRLQEYTISDGADSFLIKWVQPLAQRVEIKATSLFQGTIPISDASATDLCKQPICDYINSLEIGAPINLIDLGNVIAAALGQGTPRNLEINVFVNGVLQQTRTGTFEISASLGTYFAAQTQDQSVVNKAG